MPRRHRTSPACPTTPVSNPSSHRRREVLKFAGASLLVPPALGGCWSNDDGEPGPPDYAQTIAVARTAIGEAIAVGKAPAISVALITRERLVWAEAFGSIDRAAKIPATTDTLFCIGSCSKMLAALAVMILAERGRVELDAPLVRYLPQFTMLSPEYPRITVRMLLCHASGLPGCDYRGLFSGAPNSDYAGQVMRMLASARLKHAPGEMSVYCNDGFTLVEPLVAAATGLPYVDFVAREILAPLGMTSSRYALAPFPAGSFAPGYEGDTMRPQEFTPAYASGGLYSTPTEMSRLARLFLNAGIVDGVRLLAPASIAEMGRNQTLADPLQPMAMGDGYGLGWDGVRSDAFAGYGITAWHKSGGTDTYTSDFFVAPDQGLAVMITGSSTDYGAGALAEEILLAALVDQHRISTMPVPLTGPAAAVIPATDAELAAMEGVYAHYQGLLRVQPGTARTLTITGYAQGAWSIPVPGFALRVDGHFTADANPLVSYRAASAAGERYLLQRFPYGYGHYLWEVPRAQRITPKAPLSAVWRARIDTGRPWLVVNEPAASFAFDDYRPTLTLATVPELPGYLLVTAGFLDGGHDQLIDASFGDERARMCLKIPVAYGRDLNDLVVEMNAGEEWLRFGSTLFRPSGGVPTLVRGEQVVAIGAEGYAEWRRLAAAAVVTVRGASGWKLYASDFTLLAAGSGDLPARPTVAGAWLLLYGASDARVRVTVA